MEDLKHLCNSRKGYRIHLKKLLAKANDLIERHCHKDPDLDVVSLTDLHDQIQRKDNLISDLDGKIQKLIINDEELVQEFVKQRRSKNHYQPQSPMLREFWRQSPHAQLIV